MGFKLCYNQITKPKAWNQSQLETITKVNDYLKHNCFKPKNNLMFITSEINAYRLFLDEIESLPTELILVDEHKIPYIKIKDIETLPTKFLTKRYLLVRKIFELGGRVIYGGKNKNFRMIKLSTVRGFIQDRIKKISKENDNAYRIWGNAFPHETSVFEQITIKRTYKKFSGLKKKVNILTKESEPKPRYTKYIISLEFQDDIKAFILAGIDGLHFKHDLFKPLNMVERTVYRWKQDDKFSMELGIINLKEFYSFVKNYPKKFEFEKRQDVN